MTTLGDSAVVRSGRLWIDPATSSYGGVRHAFIESIKARLHAEGVAMSHPNKELLCSNEISIAGIVEEFAGE